MPTQSRVQTGTGQAAGGSVTDPRLPDPTEIGQVLISMDGTSWSAQKPVVGLNYATSSNPTNQWVEFSGSRLVTIVPDTAYTLEMLFYRLGAANTARIRRIFISLIPRQSLGLLPPSGG